MAEKALKTMKNLKSSGPQPISTELLKYGPMKLNDIFAFLFNIYIMKSRSTKKEEKVFIQTTDVQVYVFAYCTKKTLT